MATHFRILGQSLRWRKRRPQETYHLPRENPGVTRPEQLFLRPYGNSHRADHYAQYLRGVSEASTQVRGVKSPR